jgi:hypothetical protein
MVCPYAYVLGVPGQGIHAPRIGGYARNDIIGTIGLAVITSFLTDTSFLKNLLAWFVLGEVLHFMFGTQTAFLTTIGLKACQSEP